MLKQFLQELDSEGNLPPDFDIDLIVEAASLVMKWNIFEYGDCFILQKRGAAMGTLWAIIYYWMHEKRVVLPKYESKMPLFYRFIDDVCGIVLLGEDDGMSADELVQLDSDLDAFGPQILTWDMKQPTHLLTSLT